MIYDFNGLTSKLYISKKKKSYDYKLNLILLLQRKINIYDTVNKNVGNYFLNILLNIAKLNIFYSFISYIILL